ncbi:hypothetical protein ACIQU6_41355 [Streptomyces sp. NPDC090442]|uniref:hypothetical protein n=1 Tax=Streptomyces sp. NPDC090442 TaxID=3365962 RepID=UPI0037FC4339
MESEHQPEPVEGAVVEPLTVEAARALTLGIRQALDDARAAVGRLAGRVKAAHDARVWTVLGYHTWAEYATAEFNVSRSHAYRLLDLARTTEEITGAVAALGVLAPVSHAGDIPLELPIRAVVELRGRMGEVRDVLAERLQETYDAQGGHLTPEAVAAVVHDVVADVRRRSDVTPDELDAIELPEGAPYTVADVREGRRLVAQLRDTDRQLGALALEVAPAYWSEERAAGPLCILANELGGEDLQLLLACRRYVTTGDYRAVEEYRQAASLI